jgi:hypothetical protein
MYDARPGRDSRSGRATQSDRAALTTRSPGDTLITSRPTR